MKFIVYTENAYPADVLTIEAECADAAEAIYCGLCPSASADQVRSEFADDDD